MCSDMRGLIRRKSPLLVLVGKVLADGPYSSNCFGKETDQQRRDLLVRHEKLVHRVESSRARSSNAHTAKINLSSPNILETPLVPQSPLPPPSLIDPELLAAPVPRYQGTQTIAGGHGEGMRCSLDLLSAAANHIASKDSSTSRQSQAILLGSQYNSPYAFNSSEDAYPHTARRVMPTSAGVRNDFKFEFDNFSSSNNVNPSSHLDSSSRFNDSEAPLPQHAIGSECEIFQYGPPTDEGYTYYSRPALLQPEIQETYESWQLPNEGIGPCSPSWGMLDGESREMQGKFDNFV